MCIILYYIGVVCTGTCRLVNTVRPSTQGVALLILINELGVAVFFFKLLGWLVSLAFRLFIFILGFAQERTLQGPVSESSGCWQLSNLISIPRKMGHDMGAKGRAGDKEKLSTYQLPPHGSSSSRGR